MGKIYPHLTPQQYIDQLPPERQMVIKKLRQVIRKNLPKGFVEGVHYGMLGYVVPHQVYPAGYHCDPTQPLPFMSVASQKHFVAVYHMGIYADKKLLTWFTREYARQTTAKLDMGKGCIRFKKLELIPYQLIGELAGRITAAQWIAYYERNIKR